MSFIKLNNQDVEIDKIQEFVSTNSLIHIDIQLQSAPAKEGEIYGCQIDDVLLLCKEILCSFNKDEPSHLTTLSIVKLEETIMWCKKRAEEREVRGVEETNEE